MTVPLRLNASLLIFLVSNTRTPWFAIDGSFFTASTELPDIFTKNTSNFFKKVTKAILLSKGWHLETLKLQFFFGYGKQ